MDKSYELTTEYLVTELREWVEAIHELVEDEQGALGLSIESVAVGFWETYASRYTKELYETTKDGSIKSALEAIKQQRLLIEGWAIILQELERTFYLLNTTTDDEEPPTY